jgi:CheY-like chemotaxis protein
MTFQSTKTCEFSEKTYAWRPRTVLVIDDDKSLRSLVRYLLVDAGYDVLEASDGSEGMEMVKQATIHLLITDMVMPVQEGVETIRLVRALYPTLKILAMSGVAESDCYLEVAARLGANATLKKAHIPQLLLSSVQSLFSIC